MALMIQFTVFFIFAVVSGVFANPTFPFAVEQDYEGEQLPREQEYWSLGMGYPMEQRYRVEQQYRVVGPYSDEQSYPERQSYPEELQQYLDYHTPQVALAMKQAQIQNGDCYNIKFPLGPVKVTGKYCPPTGTACGSLIIKAPFTKFTVKVCKRG